MSTKMFEKVRVIAPNQKITEISKSTETISNSEIDKNREEKNDFVKNKQTLSAISDHFDYLNQNSVEVLGKRDLLSLIEYIISVHHKNAKESAITIHNLLQNLLYKNKYPELTEIAPVTTLFLHDVLNHIMREEKILFPNIVQLIERNRKSEKIRYRTFGLIKDSIAKIRREQVSASNEMQLLDELTHNYYVPVHACNDYVCLYKKMKELQQQYLLHIQLENEILFPGALAEDGETDKPDILKFKMDRSNHV